MDISALAIKLLHFNRPGKLRRESLFKITNSRQPSEPRENREATRPGDKMREIYDEIILGAGASGLFAGAFARGNFLILEKNARAGEKLRVCGGGKANFSNRDLSLHFYLSRPDAAFPKYCLERFGAPDILALFSQWQLPWEEREGGKYFLKTSATRLCDRLLRFVGEKILYGRVVRKIIPGDPHIIETDREIYKCRRLVIASGSPARPKLGGDDGVWKILRGLGHKVSDPEPALAPLYYPDENIFASLSGIGAKVKASWKDSLGRMTAIKGDALFTHKGLSGPAILTASLFAPNPCELELDFLPDADLKKLVDSSERSTFRSLLRKLLPDRLVDILSADAIARKNIAELSRKQRNELIKRVASAKFSGLSTAGFDNAEIARGGVSTDQINPRTFESAIAPRIYIIGEAIDVAGSLGGYNLHWAFASAKLCQERINAKLSKG